MQGIIIDTQEQKNMQEEKVITGHSEEEIWQQVTRDLQGREIFEYRAVLQQAGLRIILHIDIDLGGGFESGYAITRFQAPVLAGGFEFYLRPEHIFDEAAKWLGMQDVPTGYPEFDEHFIIKTNNEAKVKAVFADPQVRKVLCALPHGTVELKPADIENEKATLLQLIIEEGITDPARLRSVYHTFLLVLTAVEAAPA